MQNKRTNSGGMLDLPHTLLRSLTIPTSITNTDSSSNKTKPKPKDLTSLFDDLNKQSKYDVLYFFGQNEEKKTSTPTFLNEKIELPQLSDKTVKLLQNTSSHVIDRTIEKISANLAGKVVNKEGMNHMPDDKKSSTLSNIVEGILQDDGIQDSIKQIAESMKTEENQDKNSLSEDALQDVLNHPEVQKQINDLFKKVKEE